MNYSQRPQTELQKLPAGTILSSFVSESTVNILESHFTGREDKGKRKSVRQRTALLPPRGDLKHAHNTCVICSSPSTHPTVTSYFIQLCNSSFWGMAVPTSTLVAVLSALDPVCSHTQRTLPCVFAFSLWLPGFPPLLCSSQVLGAVVFPPPPSKYESSHFLVSLHQLIYFQIIYSGSRFLSIWNFAQPTR